MKTLFLGLLLITYSNNLFAGSVNIESFNNSFSPNFIMVEDALAPSQLTKNKGIVSANYTYTDDPAVVTNKDRTVRKRPLVHGMATMHLSAGYMVNHRLLLGAKSFYTKVNLDATNAAYAGGDTTLIAKYRVTGEGSSTTAAIIPKLKLPTGDKDLLLSDDSTGYGLTVSIDHDFKFFQLNVNAGYEYSENAVFGDIDYRHKLLAAIGVYVPLGDKIGLSGEIVGYKTIPFNSVQNPGEIYMGAKYNHTASLSFNGGIGVGSFSSVGGNDYRIIGGLKFIPQSKKTSQFNFNSVNSRNIQKKIENIRIDNEIKFHHDSAELTESGEIALAHIAAMLKHETQRYQKIIIEGHANRIGEEDYNQVLSERRAKSVRKFLVAQGISEKVLESIGYGETAPKYEFKDLSEKSKARENNRRVEFRVKGSDL